MASAHGSVQGKNLVSVARDVLQLITRMLDGVEILTLAETCPILYAILIREGTVRQFQVCARVRTKFLWPIAISRLAGLTHLSLCLGRKDHVASVSQWMSQALPRSLQVLRLQFVQAEELFALAPLELALVLTVQSSKSTKRDGVAVLDLSSALPDLHTLDLDGAPAVTSSAIARLPKSLTSLRLRGKDWNDDSIANLPRGLLEFAIIDYVQLSSQAMAQLPPGLTSLSLPRRAVSGAAEWALLPPSLTRYEYGSLVRVSTMSTAELLSRATAEGLIRSTINILEFPRSLVSISLSFWHTEVEMDAIALLPPNLTKLKLQCKSTITSELIRAIPRSVTHLTLKGTTPWELIIPESWPPELKYFGVSHSSDASRPVARPLNLPKGSLTSLWLGDHVRLDLPFLENIPTSVCTMSIAGASVLKTPKMVAALPRGLTRLALFALPNEFSDVCIPHLPPNLKSLYMKGGLSLSDACIQHLPRALEDLCLDTTSKITELGLSSLPSSLTSLGIQYMTIEPQLMQILPRKLHRLRLDRVPTEKELRDIDTPPGLTSIGPRYGTSRYTAQRAPVVVLKPHLAGEVQKQKSLNSKFRISENAM